MASSSTNSSRPSLALNVNLLVPSPVDSNATSELPSSKRRGPPPSLILVPASPAISPPSFNFNTTSTETSPTPLVSGSGLAARRQINKKQLSLVLQDTSIPAALVSPARLDPNDDLASLSRSLPSSPISLSTFIGVEGVEQEDRIIGRLMMKAQQDEMREQMKGGIKRRTSIPRLNLSTASTTSSKPLNSIRTNGGSAVQMIRTDSMERSYSNGPKSDPNEVEEPYPYAHGPREILKGIWLGSEENARDPKVLKDWGITHVLNVAKEVLCPWDNEVIVEEEEGEEETVEDRLKGEESNLRSSTTSSTNSTPPRQPRTKTLASTEPLSIRSTTSTPNLQSAFKSAFISSPPPPPSLSTSIPPLPSTSPITSPSRTHHSHSDSITLESQPLRFPADPTTGRPVLDWLWLQWSHTESNLVESAKLEKAFEFIDSARFTSTPPPSGESSPLGAKNGNGENRILIHCQCGVSRSATVVIAFVMREAARALEREVKREEGIESVGVAGEEEKELKGITGMHEAYSFVKDRSSFIGPNLSLVFQLVSYERVLRGAPPLEPEDDDETPNEEQAEAEERSFFRPHSTSHSTSTSPRTPISSEGGSSSSENSSGSSENSSAISSVLGKVKISTVDEEKYIDPSLTLEAKYATPILSPLITTLSKPIPSSPTKGKSLNIFSFGSKSSPVVQTEVEEGKLSSPVRTSGTSSPEPTMTITPSTSSNKLFGGATQDERRASHRRVFSLEGLNLFKKST